MKFINQKNDIKNKFSPTFDATTIFALKSGIDDSKILPNSSTVVTHICHLL
jgi:hypothetical protein